MSQIIIKPITKENEDALALPNDPFLNTGHLIPSYDGKDWSYHFEDYPKSQITEDVFPDEHYKLEEMEKGFHGLAAYLDEECVGFALLYEQWNKYLYLDNLLVPARHRKKGVASALLSAALDLSKELNKLGVWLIVQDNNPAAIKCYFKNGYTLGGMNQPVYDGTKQEGKFDLYLYKKNA